MFEVSRDVLDPEHILKLYDRLHFKANKVYVPDVVAQRYGLRGRKLSCREVKELLEKDWDKTSRLFKRYALNDCRYLSLTFPFP